MTPTYMLRHLLNDDVSLNVYLTGKKVSYADVKRRLLLKTRAASNRVPDHHYRLLQEKTMSDKGTLTSLLCQGLSEMAHSHLELYNNRIHTQADHQNDWQELLTYVPPLVLQAAYLHKKVPLSDFKPKSILDYYHHYIWPNARYTALPSPRLIPLAHYAEQNNGFHDLHIHLNGAIETDHIWQDHIQYPEKIHDELAKAYAQEKVREQLEQESYNLEPGKYYHLLRIARQLRHVFFSFVFDIKSDQTQLALLDKLINQSLDNSPGTSALNPFNDLVPSVNENHISVEMLMHVLILMQLQQKPNDTIAAAFHFYLLIYGLCNRLLVQQTHQYGFEQFQKHTLNGLREFSEKTMYAKRFLQMHGNDLNNISFIEGRFSPQRTEAETSFMMQAIDKGWNELEQKINAYTANTTNETRRAPQLYLIAHFIKRSEKDIIPFIRHKSLRIDIWKRALALVLFKKNNPDQSKKIVGVDAAASEFDASPEVFAPTFRYLRRKGFHHFTYHAGEDFHHILSGLRAMFEAINFNDMQKGDRLGHCTASGISVKQWIESMGDKMLIKRGEWLDTLTFTRYFIIYFNVKPLLYTIPLLTENIYIHYQSIYDTPADIQSIEKAWMYRKYCPLQLFAYDSHHARSMDTFDYYEYNEIRNLNISAKEMGILRRYHDSWYREKYDELITITPDEIITENNIECLQHAILHFMHQKEIIIETLPTSNIRIGQHQDFSTYHLWNWIKLKDDGHLVPPIVVGTDDTGIFATNIYNEFANIYCYLIKHTNQSRAMSVIDDLNNNSMLYRFS